MPKVFQLGYVATNCADFAKTRDYYVDVVGATEVDKGEDGTVYLSLGYTHHDIVLKPASEKSVAHLGFQLNPGTDLNALVVEAQAFGVKAQLKTDSQPGVAALVEIEAPGGTVIQCYDTIDCPAPGFKTAAVSPLRLGHLALITPEGPQLGAFLKDFLGFWFTDSIGGFANFFSCNRDHHVLNIITAPITKLHHVAFELNESGLHAQAADRLRAKDIPTQWGPSRHTAGHNLAAYHYDPDQTLIELYTDMDVWLPELGIFEPRPWHRTLPMKPQTWGPEQLSSWDTQFNFDMAQA